MSHSGQVLGAVASEIFAGTGAMRVIIDKAFLFDTEMCHRMLKVLPLSVTCKMM